MAIIEVTKHYCSHFENKNKPNNPSLEDFVILHAFLSNVGFELAKLPVLVRNWTMVYDMLGHRFYRGKNMFYFARGTVIHFSDLKPHLNKYLLELWQL